MDKTRNRNWVRRGGTWAPKPLSRSGSGKGWAHRTKPKGKRPPNPAVDAPIDDWVTFAETCKELGHQLGNVPQHIQRELRSRDII